MKRVLIGAILLASSVFFPVSAAPSQALLEQGVEAFKSQNYKSAELLFRKCIEADDDNNETAWFYLARSLYGQKRYKDSIFEFNRFLVNCRSIELCSESRFWIAESYFNMSEYLKAIEEYKRFLSQNRQKDSPLVPLSHERIGEIYLRQSRYDEAVIEWQSAYDSHKQEDKKAAIQLRITDALFLNKKYDDAESVLAVLVSNRDQLISCQASILLGRISSLKGKPRIALRYYSRIPDSLSSSAPYSDVLYFKGIAYLEIDEKNSAKTFLQTFISVGKNSLWFNHARFEIARMNSVQNAADSIAVMEDVRKMTGDRDLRIDVSLELSRLYAAQGRAADGISFLEEVRNIDDPERRKTILFELGNSYISIKNFDAAEKVFSDMASMYSFDKDADKIQFLLSVVYLKKGDGEKATDGFKKINDINPFSNYLTEANFYIASAQFEQGNYLNALKFLEEYLTTKNPDKKYEAAVLQLKSNIRLSDYAGAERSASGIIKKYSDRLGVDAAVLEFISFAYSAEKDPAVYENFI
ncbi:MAG: tetratricopeptide repeat protein, partial [Spirochaetota bacterium]